MKTHDMPPIRWIRWNPLQHISRYPLLLYKAADQRIARTTHTPTSGCKRLDTDIRAVAIDATMTDMARVALCPTHGRARPLWRTWAEPRYQYPSDGPEAA